MEISKREQDHVLWAMDYGADNLWLLGWEGGYTTVKIIHIPLFIAIIATLIPIKDRPESYSLPKISYS